MPAPDVARPWHSQGTPEPCPFPTPLDRPSLAGISRRQPDTRVPRRTADTTQLPGPRRPLLAVTCDPGRSGGVLRPHRTAGADAGAAPRSGRLDRAPRPGGVALAAIIQLVPVPHANRARAGWNAAGFHYRTEGPGRGEQETRGIERNASVGRGAARPVSGATIGR